MYAGTLLDIAMTHADTTIECAKNGDEAACGQLVNLWYKRIYNYAFKYLNDHDEAMEVTQKTFISMYRKISTLETVDKFRPWLYRIAANCCHESYRQKARQNNFFVNSKSEEDEKIKINLNYTEAPKVEAQMQQQVLNRLLQGALQHLTEEQREVIIMKEYEGLKFREIAEILEISENTVKSRLYYALSHLKQYFIEKKLTKEVLYYES